ncbi:1-phosphofructokinase [Neobacillus notoginsengisoli]|uniref:Tagatose-6-phosphate kinase n=1 Tax=Neobacillus notoginsengisoli TaxID=1578198 RepID=A0A417YYM4_9BACI|nr:1-phosphofructokinase [Neobacillus notoginsengisoli]RHW42831.1 1-phosphofructokinase [Neobacillus notoginsengisoli]
MIYTLTLNPSIDYIVALDKVELGALNRTKKEAKIPGGKGINVSLLLRSMGVDSIATGFIGGFTGRFVKDALEAKGVKTSFIEVDGETRINVKMKAEEETEINGQGPAISADDLDVLKGKIAELRSGDTLVLAGSIPSRMDKNIYKELIRICSENGTEVVVDAEGDLLKTVLPYRPFLIKPNHHELGQFFGVDIHMPDEALPFAKKLVELGAKNVIVSLAGEGAVFVNETMALSATVPKGEVRSSIGAGDSMVAGFLAKYLETGSEKEAFRYSVAAGSATAFSIGLGTKEKTEELLEEVEVTER